MCSKKTLLLLSLLLLITCGNQVSAGAEPAVQVTGQLSVADVDIAGFEARLETIQQALKIPGMSVAVVQDQQIIWAEGFGYADLENEIPATPHTPYGLASVTKPIAAVLIMQLVEQGLIDLDAPVSDYGVHMDNSSITVRHLLTHTSEGVLGTSFNYNGSRYGHLGGVIEGATGKPFAELLGENILLPLGMRDSALNPINSWGGTSLSGFQDFRAMTGWGRSFQNYPDVYLRLAKPYQFDADYNLIPGMYNLYHNPAAGMLSSVLDLAKFDIALDQGLLLAEDTKADLWTPAYSTYQNRPELMYGLGWYVQEFEDLQLLWHTGRWPPSNSALYLKIPEHNLTLIVLANTDNLTVPFYGLGVGDVTQSALTLAFWRYFVFPQMQGAPLPKVDWTASRLDILNQLEAASTPAARQFLERELWSFRQAYASSDQDDMVQKLQLVRLSAFPVSAFRADERFTNLCGSYPVIPPALAIATFAWLGRGTLLWAVLVLISSSLLVFRLLKTRQLFTWTGLLWVIATIFLGPVGLVSYVDHRPDSERIASGRYGAAWSASALVAGCYAVAWVLSLTILFRLAYDPHPLMTLGITYLLPLLVVLVGVQIPLIRRPADVGNLKWVGRGLLSVIVRINVLYAVFFSVTMLVGERWLTSIPGLTSPILWALCSLLSILGMVAILPLHSWMQAKGYRLPGANGLSIVGPQQLPTLRSAWPALALTYGILIGALVVTIAQLA